VKTAIKSTTITTTTETLVKVSKSMVDTLDHLAKVRSQIADLEKLADTLKAQVLAEVGETPATLIHRNIKVAKISEVITERPDTKALKASFPEVWNAVKYPSPAIRINVIHTTID
jgi:predicted phage-related endonuclease